MFENLTPRERILAIVMAALLPIALLMVVAFWFFGTLGQRDTEISSLQDRIYEAEALNLRKNVALNRRASYRDMSLPKNQQVVSSEYKAWLIDLAEGKSGLQKVSPSRPTFVDVKFQRREEIYSQMTLNFTAEGTLPQLTQFLYDFHSVKLMHRIANLTIAPLGTSSAEKGKPSQNAGRMKFTFSVQTASLADADPEAGLAVDEMRNMAMTLEDYNQSILFRNIFGNPNEPPEFSSSKSPSEFEERDISFSISARDANPEDILSIELLSSDIKDAELVPLSRNGTATFKAGPQKPGEYKIQARVTDTGCPPKSETMDIVLTVNQKRVETVIPTKPFFHVGETMIGGITVNSEGHDEVWVRVKTKGELHKLTVGKSFKLDDYDWTLKTIEGKLVSFETQGKILWFKNGDSLDEPIRTEVPAAAESEADTTPTTADQKLSGR